jgi:hypothetical protein
MTQPRQISEKDSPCAVIVSGSKNTVNESFRTIAPSGSFLIVTLVDNSNLVRWTAPTTIQESTDWSKLYRKLESLIQLPKGWDGYKAPLPNMVARDRARSFLDSLCRENYSPFQIAASVIGGIGVNRRHGNKKVYVEFNNNGKVHALFSDGASSPRVEPIQPDMIGFQVLIQRMRAYLDE